MSSTFFTIESFVGDAVMLASDPFEAAVKNATRQAQIWIEKTEQDEDVSLKEVVSTQVQTLPTGDYVTCIITMVFKLELVPYPETEQKP